MKIISKRSLQPYEKVVTVEDLEFIVDDDMGKCTTMSW